LIKLIHGYGQQSFQDKLREIEETYPQDSQERAWSRQKLFLTVQNKVLPKYKFPEGPRGAMTSVMALKDPYKWSSHPRFAELFARREQQVAAVHFLTHDPVQFAYPKPEPVQQVETAEESRDEDKVADAEEEHEERPTGSNWVRYALRKQEEEFEPEADVSWSGPRANFKLFKKILPMRLEKEAMTPAEITDIWENRWGVRYASRIKFLAPAESERKYLAIREDTVPLHPAVVVLEENVGSILYALSTALKEYSGFTAEEAEVAHENRLEEISYRSSGLLAKSRARQLQDLRGRITKEHQRRGTARDRDQARSEWFRKQRQAQAAPQEEDEQTQTRWQEMQQKRKAERKGNAASGL